MLGYCIGQYSNHHGFLILLRGCCRVTIFKMFALLQSRELVLQHLWDQFLARFQVPES